MSMQEHDQSPIMESEPQNKKKRKAKNTTTTLNQPNVHDQLLSTPSDFSFAILRITVSQICQSVGFRHTHLSALETLTNIAAKHLQAVAKSASSSANASNRTQSNLFDITNAFHDLSSVQGFSGSSLLHRRDFSLLRSSTLIGLASFVKHTTEIPFAKPIPRNEFLLDDSNTRSALMRYEQVDSRSSHIPTWIPRFPDSSTYKQYDGSTLDRRKNGEQLWERTIKVNNPIVYMGRCEGEDDGGGGCLRVMNGKTRKNELEANRGRVRFKIEGVKQKKEVDLKREMGLKLRNGICRGGKRVCWNGNVYTDSNSNHVNSCIRISDDDDDDDENLKVYRKEGVGMICCQNLDKN